MKKLQIDINVKEYKQRIGRNWKLKIIALFLALILWVYVIL